MAKTKKKRRRKRRGTQGGAISTRPAARPRNRQEARARARQRQASPKARGSKGARGAKGDTTSGRVPAPPSWKAALTKGALAAVLFFGLFAGLFHRPIASSAALAAFTLAFYVPLSYYLDSFMYRRHEAKAQREYELSRQPKPKSGEDDG